MVILLGKNKRKLPKGNTERMEGRHTQECENICHSQMFKIHRKNSFESIKNKTDNPIIKWAKGNYFTKETRKWPRSTRGAGPEGAARSHHTSRHLSPSTQLTHENRHQQASAPLLAGNRHTCHHSRPAPPSTPYRDVRGSAGQPLHKPQHPREKE